MFTINNALKFTFVFSICLNLFACSGSDQQAQLLAGEEIVKKNCKVCHASGINGAPIIGNKKQWQPRLEKGKDALVTNAINGVGLMPAKGGRSELTDEQIALAVDYYIYQLK